MDEYWDSLIESLWSAESWMKVVGLLVTAPIWYPVVRSMWREVHEVLAPEGGLYANNKARPIARRAPGDDPFLNIPLASHRARQKEARELSTHELVPASRPGRSSGRTPARGFARRTF